MESTITFRTNETGVGIEVRHDDETLVQAALGGEHLPKSAILAHNISRTLHALADATESKNWFIRTFRTAQIRFPSLFSITFGAAFSAMLLNIAMMYVTLLSDTSKVAAITLAIAAYTLFMSALFALAKAERKLRIY